MKITRFSGSNKESKQFSEKTVIKSCFQSILVGLQVMLKRTRKWRVNKRRVKMLKVRRANLKLPLPRVRLLMHHLKLISQQLMTSKTRLKKKIRKKMRMKLRMTLMTEYL